MKFFIITADIVHALSARCWPFFLYRSFIVDSKYIIFHSQNIHAKCSGIDEEMRRDKWNGSRQQQVHRLINVINGVHNNGPVGRMEAR